MRSLTPLWLLAVVVSLNASAQTLLTKETSRIRIPMGIVYGISDARCETVKSTSIPKRLEELEIPFEWTDVDKGLLTVGSFLEKAKLGLDYSSIRQTYFLNVTCDSELTVRMSGEAALEGLLPDGQWIVIADSETVDQHGLEFFQKLDL